MAKLDPTARDFEAIVAELTQRVREQFNDRQTDPTNAGFTSMLIDLFAAVGDGLHFQLDNALLDLFWETVRDIKAATKLAALFGYRPKAASAATVSLRFTRVKDDDTNSAVTIPARTPVATADGEIVFETLHKATLLAQQKHVDVPAEHARKHRQTAEISTQPDQVILAENTPFVEGSVAVTENGTVWQCVDDFLASGPHDPHYYVTVDTEQRLCIHLGNGLHGRIPNGDLTLNYRAGGGTDGNILPGTLNTLEQALYDDTGREVEVTVTNPKPACGGAPPETVPQIRRNALLKLRSQRRAVTAPDIVDQALTISGVARVKLVTRDRDSRVPPHAGFLYVAANATSTAVANTNVHKGADDALLERVRRHFADNTPTPVGFVLHVAPAPLLPINLSWKIWLTENTRASEVETAIRNALHRFLSPEGNQPWGTLPHPSQLVCVAHQAHADIAGVQLLTDLQKIAIQPHQLPVLGNSTFTQP